MKKKLTISSGHIIVTDEENVDLVDVGTGAHVAATAEADPAADGPETGSLWDWAKWLEQGIARWFRLVHSRYTSELRNGFTVGKAYRVMWMTVRDMANAGVLPNEPWVGELVDDLKVRAVALGARGNHSGDLGDGSGEMGDGTNPWSEP